MGPKICSPRFQLRNSSRDRLFWRKSRQLRECWLAVWLLTIELGWRTVIYSRTKRHGSPNATAPVRGWSRPRNAGQLLNRSLAAARDFSFAERVLRHGKLLNSYHRMSHQRSVWLIHSPDSPPRLQLFIPWLQMGAPHKQQICWRTT